MIVGHLIPCYHHFYCEQPKETINSESGALEIMEKDCATEADTEPRREMLRELQGKKKHATNKLAELDKSQPVRAASITYARAALVKGNDTLTALGSTGKEGRDQAPGRAFKPRSQQANS